MRRRRLCRVISAISAGSAIISLIIAIIGWTYTYKEYMVLSKRDAAAWLDAKPIPELEGH